MMTLGTPVRGLNTGPVLCLSKSSHRLSRFLSMPSLFLDFGLNVTPLQGNYKNVLSLSKDLFQRFSRIYWRRRANLDRDSPSQGTIGGDESSVT